MHSCALSSSKVVLELVIALQEVAIRSVTKTQVEVENGEDEEEAAETVSVYASVAGCLSVYMFEKPSNLVQMSIRCHR